VSVRESGDVWALTDSDFGAAVEAISAERQSLTCAALVRCETSVVTQSL
jgi:hypothetical protein